MKKIIITMVAIAFSLSAWSFQIKVLEVITVEGLGTFEFYCIDGYQYVKAFRSGTAQMFEKYGDTSIPIECSMD